MERDWSRLARAIVTAREQLDMTQMELARALGIGRSAVQKLERGFAYSKIQPTHRAAARLFNWTGESVELVLAGGDPVMAPARPTGRDQDALTAEPSLDDLPLRVLQAIGQGRLVDSIVINLDPDDPEATATLVLKRGVRPDAPTDQMRDDLRKWSALQRAALEIYGDDQST